MEPIINPIDKHLIVKELDDAKFVCRTNRGGNVIFEVTADNAPYTMQEIGRLREIAFRSSGGGTGKAVDIDEFDLDKDRPYHQLIVFDPDNEEIMGGYRYIDCAGGINIEKMATKELFNFSDKFVQDILPYTIELGRSFVHPMYQRTNLKRKGIFAMDNLWDGLGALIVKYSEHRYFFGKVTMYTTYTVEARNILLTFMNKYFPDKEGLVYPIKSLDYDPDNFKYKTFFANLDYKQAYKILSKTIRDYGEVIPPLINSYMNLSPNMRVFGTSINAGFGGVEETGILVTIRDIYPEKTERHTEPIRRLARNLKQRYLWWRNPYFPHSIR